jgi:hypothetical protein
MQKGALQLPITGVASGNQISLEAPFSGFSIRIQGTVSGDQISAVYAQIMSGSSQPFFSRNITMHRSSTVAGENTSSGANPPPQDSSTPGGTASATQNAPSSLSQQSAPSPPADASAGAPRIVQAIIQPGATSLQLVPGRFYIYGFATGGARASDPFAVGQYAQAVDISGFLASALAYGTNDSNNFTTTTYSHAIGGVSVAGAWDTSAAFYGSNSQPGVANASVNFAVPEDSFVVFVGLAGGQENLTLQGIPGMQVDQSVSVSDQVPPMVIAHALLGPGDYIVTSLSSSSAVEQQNSPPKADLIGVFVFGSKH